MMLYIHIPFCEKKCDYCDFLSFANYKDKVDVYLSALCNEISIRHPEPIDSLSSIYIGGGTPSILSPSQLERLFDCINKYFYVPENAEITMEINPGATTASLIESFDSLPINRVSIGLQSADNEELKILGRIHQFSDFLKNYELIAKGSISNINVDIMTGIPKQTSDSLEKTLRIITGLRPAHISTYALILEEGTPFFKKYTQYQSPLPNEEEEYNLYRFAVDFLADKGYKRYEISNYAKDGYESRHNTGYWDRLPYLGVGLGASSFYNHTRYKNTTDMDKYLSLLNSEAPQVNEDFYDEVSPLTKQNEIEEFMFLGLRKTSGIILGKFEMEFGTPIDTYYRDTINKLVEQGFLERTFGMLKLTDLGTDLSNQVLAQFLF